ncbi:(2Fe-2S)-binding protein [Kitasatospora sp. NPDC101183]|uniref:(2Fe-2S)-binding protein n=1 Tax=Kitasatospora sp. NPDC101183 TaxID=3364100 RepID=UPI00382302F1
MVTAETLARLDAVSPYFTLAVGPRPDADAFRPLADLHRSPAVLDEYVDEVARSLATRQRRVAASTLHLGVAARLWSVALGVLAFTGRVPDLDPERLHWRRVESGPLPPWLPEQPGGELAHTTRAAPTTPAAPNPAPAPTTRAAPNPAPAPTTRAAPNPAPAPTTPAADALAATVLAATLDPLGAAMRARYGLSAHVLRGNAASALVGAARMLHTRAAGAPHPTLPAVTTLLTTGPLAQAGEFTPAPIAYRRRNCCLYYRVPGAGICGDCVLRRA